MCTHELSLLANLRWRADAGPRPHVTAPPAPLVILRANRLCLKALRMSPKDLQSDSCGPGATSSAAVGSDRRSFGLIRRVRVQSWLALRMTWGRGLRFANSRHELRSPPRTKTGGCFQVRITSCQRPFAKDYADIADSNNWNLAGIGPASFREIRAIRGEIPPLTACSCTLRGHSPA